MDGVKRRVLSHENWAVDPLLDTFDALHLQEVSLRTKLLNRSTRVKNSHGRRGGLARTREKAKHNDLINLGCVTLNARTTDKPCSQDVKTMRARRPSTKVSEFGATKDRKVEPRLKS